MGHDTIQRTFQSTRSQDRDRARAEYNLELAFQSTRSQDRDERRTGITVGIDLFQSTRSQDRDRKGKQPACTAYISIHSVARPRHSNQFSGAESGYFNPLGRKTETIPHKQQQNNRNISIHSVARPRQRNIRRSHKRRIFQSTRSQDRDQYWNIRYNASIYFNPLGRKTETAKLNNY